MNRFSHAAVPGLFGLALAALAACGAAPTPTAPSPGTGAVSEAERLRNSVEQYWAENAGLTPWYSWGGSELKFGATPGGNIAPRSLADSLALERRYLAEVSALPRAALDAESALTYDLFRRERLSAIEGYTYPFELLPVNPYDAMPQQFALMAPGAERLALSSAEEFENWRARTESFVRWTQQAIGNMRDGMRRGYTLPRPLVERTLPQLAALGDDTPANVFIQAAQSAGNTSGAERTRLSAAMSGLVTGEILPAYRALHDFLLHEYLPRSRTSVALADLPLGDAWYAYLARRNTGTAQTPAQLHALGLAEVERQHQRMTALLAETAFAGNAQGFLEHMQRDPRFAYTAPADLSSAYQNLKVQVAAAVPALFSGAPRADLGIRSVETYREAVAAPLSYRPRAPNGIIAAVLYVNMAQLGAGPATGLAAQFLREAVPGHHYQIELQRERADLPRFRRFGTAPAFVEGWGLYAATLGEELGLYPDPEAKFGSLLAQSQCAAGLVIDTGVHAQGWTRQQALDYLHAQVPIGDMAAANAVDRIIALPGEASACTVGLLKIQGLRAFAQQTLGGRFDLRAFHGEVVKDGAMPLDMLEVKLKAWIESVPSGAAPPVAAAPKIG
jgi:uncharacterized protein (DUF885 family)